ncbi:MAG: hypothetical protein JJ895_09220 [Balneolaceae bacterium]|nr:hypothetical protein [Balneolaceae bacterium]
MNYIKAFSLILLFIFSSNSIAIGQQSYQFNSTFVANNSSNIELLTSVRMLFNDLMILNGAELSEKEHMMFLINISEEIDDQYFAISITSLNSLPERVIKSGKDGQVFYSNLKNESLMLLTEEQAQVREYMSENYIRQFYSIVDSWMLVVTRKTIERELEKFVKDKVLKQD